MKKLSIIMPAYNCEKTIKKSINSVLTQNFDDFELIIINDGSSDNTAKILKTIKDTKLIIVNQKNQGPSAARNNGISIAQGKYIMFIDADDIYKNDAIKIMYEYIEKLNVDIVTAAYQSFNDNKKYSPVKINTINSFSKKEDYIYYLQSKGILNSNWNKIYKSNIIKENKIVFDKNKEIGEDIRFNLEYLKYATSYATVKNVIYDYYINDYGLSKKNYDTREERIISLMQYQSNYYVDLNLTTSKYQKIVFKNFFNIYHSVEADFSKYLKILDGFKVKIIRIYILEKIIKSKWKIPLNAVIKLYKRIR